MLCGLHIYDCFVCLLKPWWTLGRHLKMFRKRSSASYKRKTGTFVARCETIKLCTHLILRSRSHRHRILWMAIKTSCLIRRLSILTFNLVVPDLVMSSYGKLKNTSHPLWAKQKDSLLVRQDLPSLKRQSEHLQKACFHQLEFAK